MQTDPGDLYVTDMRSVELVPFATSNLREEGSTVAILASEIDMVTLTSEVGTISGAKVKVWTHPVLLGQLYNSSS